MATILLTAELGQGLGHVTRLLPIAEELEAHGHRPVFALRDVRTGIRFLQRAGFTALQAPYWQLPVWQGRRPFVAATYTDLLARHGYDNEDDLSAMVQAWDALLEYVQPQLIIADHSPTVCLAAADRVPVVLVGDGFTIPPASEDGFGRVAEAEPAAGARQVLGVVQAVQRRRGRSVPQTLPSAFAASVRFLVTFKELDPYRAIRQEEPVGPIAGWGKPAEPPDEPRVFAYLDAHFDGAAAILTAFAAAGIRCSAYLRNQTPELIDQLHGHGVELHDAPQPLAAVLPSVSAIVHHAGLNTSTAALAAGRPQLVLPRYLEQDLNAAALDELGVGRVLGGRQTMQSIGEALRGLIEDRAVVQTAHYIAHEIYARGPRGSLQQIVEQCRQLI